MASASPRTRKRYYDNHYRVVGPRRGALGHVQIPADIEIREHSGPCFLCGTRDGCKHRRHV